MAKDRARPFSRKHRRYWLPVTGGMILIGAINVAIGLCSYESPDGKYERIQLPLKSTSSGSGSATGSAGSAGSAGVGSAGSAAGSGSSGAAAGSRAAGN